MGGTGASTKKRRSSSAEPDDVYTVEKIAGRRTRNVNILISENQGKVEYLIKWENYDDKDNTWEAEDNVFCDDLIIQYNLDHPEDTTEVLQDSATVSGSGIISSLSGGSSNVTAASIISSTRKPRKSKSEMVALGIWEDDVDEVITMEKRGDDLYIHLRWYRFICHFVGKMELPQFTRIILLTLIVLRK